MQALGARGRGHAVAVGGHRRSSRWCLSPTTWQHLVGLTLTCRPNPPLPHTQGVTPQQLVAREFALVYTPQNVAAVNMIQDTSALEPLVAEYNKVRVYHQGRVLAFWWARVGRSS